MFSLYLGSNHAYAGKTLWGLVLVLRYKAKGARVGFFKPVGVLPMLHAKGPADEDAVFLKEALELQESLELICPVILTEELLHAHLQRNEENLQARILEAYRQVSKDKDFLLVGGVGQAWSRGEILGLSGPEVADLLNLKVALIGRVGSLLDLDGLLATGRAFGDRVVAAILNRVPREQLEVVLKDAIPYLRAHGLPVMGALPLDPLLHAISVKELAEALGAEVLCAQERLGELVQHFLVGAMSLESAREHFRHIADKVVITGGDRPDIILAALQTPTTCIILTGNLDPSPAVRARSHELGVQMLLVAEDTISTVEKIESIMARLRVREPRKVERARRLAEVNLDFSALDKLVGGK
jgi:BioD-like phosphotransacetylase family protein